MFLWAYAVGSMLRKLWYMKYDNFIIKKANQNYKFLKIKKIIFLKAFIINAKFFTNISSILPFIFASNTTQWQCLKIMFWVDNCKNVVLNFYNKFLFFIYFILYFFAVSMVITNSEL